MAQYPAGWTAEAEREFQATLRPKTPEGWSPEAEAAYQDQFGADAIDYANQGVRSLGRGTLNAVADVTGLGGQALRQMGVDPSFLPAENVSQGFRSAAGAIPDVPIVQDAPSGVAKFVSTTGADALGQALPGMATMGAGAAARLGTRAVGFLGAGLGAAQGATQGGREAAEYGASNAEQWGAFLLNGGLSMADAIVPSKILARLDEATGGGIKKAALSIVADGTQGGGIEMLQQAGLDAYAQGTFDPERDILGSVGEAGAGGGFASTVLSVLGQVAGIAKARGIKKGEAAPPPDADTATFTEEPVEQPFGNSEGLDLTGQSGAVAEQTTGAAPLPVTSPSGDAGAAATIDKPQAVEPAPDAGSRREQTPAASPRIIVAEMPKGAKLGDDLTGEPVYSKVERGPVARPGAGVPQPKVTQPGIFDEVGGLFEAQAYGTEEKAPETQRVFLVEEQGQPAREPTRDELLAHPAVRAELQSMADEAGEEGVGGQLIRGESDNLGSGRGEVIGRTRKNAKAEWWGRRPNNATEAAVKRAVRKALDGKPLSASDQEIIDWMATEAAHRVPPKEFNYEQDERDAIQSESWATRERDPEVPFDAPDPTSIKNKTVRRELDEMGLPHPDEGVSTTFAEQWEKAKASFDADPRVGEKLLSDLEAADRPPRKEENAILALEVNRLLLERDAARKAYNAEQSPENIKRNADAREAYARAADILKQAGRESSGSLNFRRMMVNRDYSLAALEAAEIEANQGEPITEARTKELEAAADKIAELEKKLAEATTQRQKSERDKALKDATKSIDKRKARVQRERQRDTGRAQVRSRLDKNLKRLAELGRSAHSTLGFVKPEAIKVAGEVALDNLRLGLFKFSEFADAVATHYGESIRPHLQAVWNEQIKAYRAEIAAPLEKRLKAGAKLTDLRTYIDQITESFYVDGVTDSDKLADAVHGVLKVADPSITREQTVAAISHYGEFKQLSQEEPAKGLRTIRGELRETAKLADLAKGIPPKKTGVEYPEPSGKQRRLAKRVREEMKRLGIRTTDAATQLKSALESAKTRARNRIDDLTTAIDTRTQIKNGERVAVSDAELVELKAKRTELEKVYADLFQGPKDDPKIRTLVDSIADLDTRIAAGDTSTRGPKQGPEPRADIAALKAERAEKAKTLAEMRKAADAKTSEERIADQVKKLETRRDALKGKLFDAGEGGSVAPTGTKQGPDVARVAELKAEIASLNETIGDIRDAQNPKLSDEARATASHERRAARRLADTQAVMRSGNFEKPTRQTEERIKSPTEIETLTELALAKRIVDRGRYETEQRKRTLRRKVLDAALAPFKAVKSIFSSTDFSAVGRQGAFFTAQDMILPNRWPMLARRLGRMFHAFASEKAFEEFNTELQHDPAYPILTKGGMQFTGMHDPLTAKEELFQSDLAERILVLKHLVKASNRAYVSYLNLLRLEHGKRILAASDGSKEAVQQTAKLVNAATGRANMKPGAFKNTVQASGNFLWAPNLYVSRFQLLAGEPLWGGNAHTRKLVLKEYAKTAAALASMYALIDIYRRMNPDDDDAPTVTWDPHSPDFGKIKFGNTRLDPLFGLSQTARLVYREGESFIAPSKGDNPFKIGEQFLERKFTPTISVPYELITEKELGFYGRAKPRPQNIGEAIQRIAPLSVQDVLDTMQEQGVPRGAALTVLSIFGMSLQTYEDNKK